ncbi:MAG TPA: hypothetical protein VG714_07435 [Acidobacteriaceae bacterium]|nr:hypothetical protein [Acidobacteriaceae bacterium]
MTLPNLKSMFTRSALTKSLLGAAAAAALLFSAPAKSDAQVIVAARIGRPAAVVVAARPRPYVVTRREAIARRNAEIRHEEWLRAHRYHSYGYYR